MHTHSENDVFTITLYVTQVLQCMTTPCDTHILSPVSILRKNVIWMFLLNSFSYADMVDHIIMSLVLNLHHSHIIHLSGKKISFHEAD